ncbi:MAG: hypothetical protein C0603_13115 [Denitrovibrio sp.]|nr:MAG: hypothetical protein C0603_13115 [Denitrovibrio sp.]
MKKILVALMIVAFAATAFADVTLSGSYKARGNYMANMASVDSDSDDKNMFYDHDLDIWLKASTDKDTYFKSKIELLDGQWKEDGQATKTGAEIQIERAWLGHNFGAVTLDVGMMDGAAWSYAFGNTVDAYYRVKATAKVGGGTLVALTQKNYENNVGSTTKDAEKDDSDTYFVGYKMKVAGLMFTPSIAYTVDGSTDVTDQDADTTTTKFDMGIGGNFGAIGFESEIIYAKKETETADDPTFMNLYANVFTKVAGAKVGFLTAYSSVDKDNGNKAMGMGEDFDDMYFLVLGDYNAMGNVDAKYYSGGLKGVWASALYADFAVNAKANVYGSLAYAKSNFDNDDTSAMELDLGATYKITSALSYGVDFGYAKIDADTGTDPDAAILLQHYLKISF